MTSNSLPTGTHHAPRVPDGGIAPGSLASSPKRSPARDWFVLSYVWISAVLFAAIVVVSVEAALVAFTPAVHAVDPSYYDSLARPEAFAVCMVAGVCRHEN